MLYKCSCLHIMNPGKKTQRDLEAYTAHLNKWVLVNFLYIWTNLKVNISILSLKYIYICIASFPDTTYAVTQPTLKTTSTLLTSNY